MGERALTSRLWAWAGRLDAGTWGVDLDVLRAHVRPLIASPLITWSRALNAAAIAGLVRRVAAPVELDRGAALLAAPLAMGLGAALYLGLDAEPLAWPAPLLAAAATIGGFIAWRSGRAWPARLAALLAFLAAGFALADLRVAAREAPRVEERRAPYDVEGWVESIDASTPERRRYTIRVARLDGASIDIPKRVRVGARAGVAGLGDAVRLRAVLAPPEGPPTPGAYDFSRSAYFEQLGGVGYVVGGVAAAPDLEIAGSVAWGRRITALRGALTERLRAAGGPEAGGVLAALVTGDRSEIDPGTTDALYVSGLGHILSISGMHLALVGGGAFFLFGWVLASIEPLARRMNVRKLAALCALAVSFGYLMISGGEAPAVRSFVMAGIAFAGILADRRALTQRGVAIAALLILAVAPENAAAPGFQMSFAAVVALVAANDAARSRELGEGWRIEPKEPGIVGAVKRFLIGLTLTSLVAGAATAPFAAYHFNRVAVMSFFANLIAMPVFSLIVMPAAAIAGVLAPFGLEDLPAWIGARGIDVVVAIGEWSATLPAAQTSAAAAPPIALALAAIGLAAWAVIAKGRWRLAAPFVLGAAALWHTAPQGQIWLGEEGGWLVQAPSPNGVVWVGEIGRGEDYGAELYARRAGGPDGIAVVAPAESEAFACDAGGCVGTVEGRVVAIADRWSSVVEDCARGADLVLTPGFAPPRVAARCEGVTLIPRRGRADRGAVVQFTADAMQLMTPEGAARPWRPQTG